MAYIISNGESSEGIVLENDTMTVRDGGMANNTRLESLGFLFVSSGGTANSTTVNGGFYGGGHLTISSGGTVNYTTVNSGGHVYVSSGGMANYTNVNYDGNVYVFNSGIANSTTVNSGGHLTISSGGTANYATVNARGHIYVSSGGTANNIAWTPCVGYVEIEDGACVTFTSEYSGVYYGANNVLLSQAQIMNSTEIKGSMYVMSGGTANGTTVNSGYYLNVFSGGTANNTTVNSGGTLSISSEGKAMDIIENGGYVRVMDGANVAFLENTISGLLLKGSVTIHSGTTAIDNTINLAASMIIFNGGIANSTILGSNPILWTDECSYLYISSGGVASNTLLKVHGKVHVSSGGTAINTTIGNGSLSISKGGIAHSTTISSGGTLTVFSGAVADSITIIGHGVLDVSSGGIANNNTVEFGVISVKKGGVVNNTTMRGKSNDAAVINLSSGGTANSTILNEGGCLWVSNGKANSTTINYGGYLRLYSGAAYNTEVNSGGSFIVYNFTGETQSTTVNSGGYMIVGSGGIATEIIENGGYVYIADDTRVSFSMNTFSNLVLNSGNSATVHSGTTAINTTVNTGGKFYISSGGTATEIVENGGYVYVAPDTSVSFSTNTFSNLVLNSGNSATVHSGTTAENTTINNGGKLIVYRGGIAKNIVWTPFVGILQNATDAEISFANHLEGVFYGSQETLISSALILENVIAQNGQEIYVMSQGLVNSAVVSSGGVMFVSSGGTANNTVVCSSGSMRVVSGGTAAHVEASSGALLDFSVEPNTYIEGSFADSAFEIKDGNVSFFSINSGTILRVLSGGVASRTYVYASGNLRVSKSGVANRTVLSKGTMYISSGGVADSTTINSGNLFISSGGMADHTTMSSNGSICVLDGGVASNTLINSGGLCVSSGGKVDTITLNNNSLLNVSSGGTATNITASSTQLRFEVAPETYITGVFSGSSFIIQNGIVSNYTVNQSGCLQFFSGGVADHVTINRAGSMTVLSSGITDDAIVNGSMWVSSGGTAIKTTINSYMWLSGGVAIDTIVNGSMWVSSGGMIYNTTINKGGKLWIYEGVSANSTEINNSGCMWLSSGGIASDVTINSGGSLKIEHAKLTGSISIASGGVIHAGAGTIVDFDISHLAPNMGVLLNNMSLIQDDAPAFSLTVSDLQWNGVYTLAKGAAEFDNLISVKSISNETIHMVAIGETANVDGVEYTLSLVDDTLSVTVTGGKDIPTIPIVADSTELTNQDVTLTAGFSDNAIMREYSFDNIIWHVYTEPVKCEENGIVYFLGKDQRGYVNEIASYEIKDIDKTPPNKPTATADISAPTNGSVTVVAMFSEDSVVREYSLDNETWLPYAEGVVFKENGSIYFRSFDVAGNMSEVTTYVVDCIDKTPPEVPTASANITGPTNQDVTVTAKFSNDSVVREYSLDGQTWVTYSSGIKFTKNGSVSFRGRDAAGNVSDETIYTVSNIDKVVPEKPSASADITVLTNGDVLVSAVFSEDSANKQYSLDGQTWSNYTGAVKFATNGTVYFRGIDAAGNISELETYIVSNIDKDAPNKPVAIADITVPTNGIVHVSALFNEKSVFNEYSLNKADWMEYTGSIEFSKNGTIFFRSTDVLGNVSETTMYEVVNIDTVAPEKPTVFADITTATKQDVTVSAVFSDDSVIREYSLDGQTWEPYIEPIVFTANGSVSFRGKDEAGNVSGKADYVVNNIHKAPTGKPIASADITTPTNQTVTVSAVFDSDSVKNEYSINGLVWLTYVDGVRMLDNGVVYFRSTNALGSVSEIEAYMVDYIDKVAPDKPFIFANSTKLTNQDVTITAVYSEDSTVKEYSTDGQNWLSYTGTITVTENCMMLFRAKDEAGNNSGMVSFEVSNIDKDAPVITLIGDSRTPAEQVTLTASVDDGSMLFYRIGDSEWTAYPGAITVSANAIYSFKATDAAGNTGTAEIVFRNIQSVATVPENLVGTQDQVSWTPTGTKQYIVEYSTDNFEHVVQVVTSAFATDLLNLPAGTYQWRVKADDNNSDWAIGEAFVAEAEANNAPKVVKSNEDGNDDLFFASTNGTWENFYYAQNVGSINDWTGTNEIISASGKGRIQNLFFGSSDPNVLCLTDGENGDAIFMDDVYTELPESVAEHTARLYKIQEVRAGAGDDIVDMTSQRFEYVGDGLTIRGGDGNDTMWATKGNNWLFGDAGNDRIVGASGNDVIVGGIGNDRMHGGGGEDVFTFCDNWGADTVEQLEGGSVTLWFASGDESNWNETELTYLDGDNTVKVSGVTSVTLKFGNDDSEQYASLASAGAFAEFSSKKIFEESDKGILA